MAKVLTFSRTFPTYHPKAGQPTYFVEKILSSIDSGINPSFGTPELDGYFSAFPDWHNFDPKHHTIRAGNHWKVGDKFSPCVWSGTPYRSKQIIIAPNIEVKKVWDFIIRGSYTYLSGNYLGNDSRCLQPFALNDGLSIGDFLNWFKYPCHPHFYGQIICWNENINY